MNFFEQQRQARHQTARLILLMVMAVACLILLTSLPFVIGAFDRRHNSDMGAAWRALAFTATWVSGIVLAGSLYKFFQLRGGGKVVAQTLGGRSVNEDVRTLEERQLMNVVEEMALASGVPVPAVYLLPDESINAFAAGFTTEDAAIGVTQGAITLLTRDELQGVIAHEFSHIYNGDMRLNTRLVAVVHGILVLGLAGASLLAGLANTGKGEKRDGRLVFVLACLGLILCAAGFAGSYFGNLIKAAVSRQREFLADASAVQFTRNPQGLAGALKKIASQGSSLSSPRAQQFSHLYFSDGSAKPLKNQLATHPDIGERIRRIDPLWDGSFTNIPGSIQARTEPRTFPHLSDVFSMVPDSAMAVLYEMNADQAPISTIGVIPQTLKDAAHSTGGAQAIVYGLLISRSPSLSAIQLDALRDDIDTTIFDTLNQLHEPLSTLNPGLRVPLLDLAISSLKHLDKKPFAAMKQTMNRLINADNETELLEWTLLRIVERNVEGAPAVQFKFGLFQCAEQLLVLLNAMARAGQQNQQAALQALHFAWEGLTFEPPEELPIELEELAGLEAAIKRLRHLMPEERPALLNAMTRCVMHDGVITVAEAEIFRAVADLLDCPLPPFLVATADA
ncbi:M48 family metallopeptidase [Pseudomonas sp. P1.31]|jgi:Zn-dependent protease with chaperone function/uncharacterized tellurite resistance protein B-like protein|uniref:M48 family metallopeptidase n=1 Tax=unclassified Pseudomonas TaxID=196821 RepID=UPI00069E242F|nr:M48 family metallopeptidase [Pseudomonas sp. P1.31]